MDWSELADIAFWGFASLTSLYASNRYRKKAEQAYIRTRSAQNAGRYTNTVDDIFAAIESGLVVNRGHVSDESNESNHSDSEDSQKFVGVAEHSLPRRIFGGEYFSVERSQNAPPLPRELNTLRIKKLGMKILQSSVVFDVMVIGRLHTGSPHHITSIHPTIATVGYSDSGFFCSEEDQAKRQEGREYRRTLLHGWAKGSVGEI